jgi:acyl carrier protein
VMPPSTAVPADADKLTQHGMDSLMATHLSSILAERFDLNLSPAIAFEYPTLESLAARIVELTQRRHVA